MQLNVVALLYSGVLFLEVRHVPFPNLLMVYVRLEFSLSAISKLMGYQKSAVELLLTET